VVALLRNLMAPYPVPAPCAALALAALAPEAVAMAQRRLEIALAERQRVEHALAALPGVRRVYPSSGNYLLARFDDADAVFARLLAVGVVVRDMRAHPVLSDALRISIGSPAENDALLAALAGERAGVAA